MTDLKKKNKPAELTDHQLEQVSGGLEMMMLGRRQITTCDGFRCVWCGCSKASSAEKSHVCHPQGDAVFENTCEWCEYRYTCDKAYTYVGFGSPVA